MDWAERFRRHAESIVPRPAFDPRSRLVYSVGAAGLLFEIGLAVYLDVTIGNPKFARAFFVLVALLVPALLARR